MLKRGLGSASWKLTFEEAEPVLELTDGPNIEGWYHGFCPSHDDKQPSFACKEDEDTGELVVHCFASCSVHEIYDAIRELLRE